MSALPTPARRPRAVEPVSRPELSVVPARGRGRRYGLAATFLVALALFGRVSLNAATAEEAFDARELRAEVETLSLRYDELVVEVAVLEAPARIRRIARKELGMVRPDRPVFLDVDNRRRSRGRSAGGALAGGASTGSTGPAGTLAVAPAAAATSAGAAADD